MREKAVGIPRGFPMGPKFRHAPPSTPHPLLPAHARLPRPLPARLADAQAAGNAPRTGRATVGGTGRPVAGEAGEPATAVVVGVSDGGVAGTGEEPYPSQQTMLRKAGRMHAVHWGAPWRFC